MKIQLVRSALVVIVFASISACSTHTDPIDVEASKDGIDQVTDQSKLSVEQQDDYIAQQKEKMKQQERDLQDLRRQKFHDDYFRSQYEKRAE